MICEYHKLNRRPIEIECVPDEHEEENDFKPSFWWYNRRYFLENFIQVHHNLWMGFDDTIPEYIHGVEADKYVHPLFVELIGDSAVNVYEERVYENF